VAFEMLLIISSANETIKNRSGKERNQAQVGCADHCERENLEFQKFGKIRQNGKDHCASALPRSARGNQDAGGLRELLMKNSISKAAYTGLGHCSVCGQWTKLEMWDDGLNGRFCSECFDHVVDAGELLASQGLLPPGPETTQMANNS
jgi:hypothetical protein